MTQMRLPENPQNPRRNLQHARRQTSKFRHEGPHSGKDPEMRNLTEDGIFQKPLVVCSEPGTSYLLVRASIFLRLSYVGNACRWRHAGQQPLRS